jgi:hypothetical protein
MDHIAVCLELWNLALTLCDVAIIQNGTADAAMTCVPNNKLLT